MDLATIVIETPRTRLSAFRPEDTEVLNAMRNDPEVRRYLPRKSEETISETQRLLKKMAWDNQSGSGINLSIRHAKNDALLGYIGLWKYDAASGTGELGYLLAKAHWNQGIATEALAGFFDFTITHYHIQRIYAAVHPENRFSIRLLEKHDFAFAEWEKGEDIFAMYVRVVT